MTGWGHCWVWEVKECIQNFDGERAFFNAEKEIEGYIQSDVGQVMTMGSRQKWLRVVNTGGGMLF
jgi:hypothetical protein